MKIAIVGGHLSPALSIIEKLPSSWQVIFIGRKYNFEEDKTISLEYKLIKKLGVDFEDISTGRFQRKFTKHTILSFFKIPQGLLSSFKILNRHKPDVLLGFGGYLQLPLVIAAYLKRIPIVIHEQTLEAGMSNQISAKFAKKICISWESSARFFPKGKVVFTGLPVRSSSIVKKRTRNYIRKDLPTIFVTGGSAGSHFINTLIGESLPQLLRKYYIIHQTGDSRTFQDFEKLDEIRKYLPDNLKKRYTIKKFIDPSSFSSLISQCELVIARAGVNTVSEILLAEKPSILVPIPFSQKQEQFKNSQFLQELGLAEIIEQKKATTNLLVQKIDLISKNKTKYTTENRFKTRFEDAAGKLVDVLKKCVEEK